ncbi:MAG: hypothetical protein KGL63_13755 [Betaproteobacteria bacterium]|nr:hypothetical protein [Betaproteobacteria bacterium]
MSLFGDIAGAGLGFLTGGASAILPGAILGGMASGGSGGLTGATGGYTGGSFTPPNMTGAANNAYAGIGNMTVNPYAMPMAQAAYGQAGNALQAGQQFNQLAQDPQQQLYNYLYSQNQNQAGANEAARGLSMSPVGAQMSNQAGQNFNMNWQNQQLNRQAQGLQGLLNANTSAGNLGQLAYQFGNAPNQLAQQQIQDYLNYGSMGQAGAGQNISAFNATAPYQQAAIGSMVSGLGSGMSNLGSGLSSWYNNLGANAAYGGSPWSSTENIPT